MSFSYDVDRQFVAQAHTGTLLDSEREQAAHTHIEWLAFSSIRLSERSHTQQIINYDYMSMTLWNRQTYRHRKPISGCLEWVVTSKGQPKVLFGSDGTILYLSVRVHA